MTDTTCVLTPSRPAPDDRDASPDLGDRVAVAEGWQALALAAHGAPLSAAELAAAELLPAEVALDLLFPDLDDAARHEALWALGDSAPPPR